jgi:hypothetical protein
MRTYQIQILNPVPWTTAAAPMPLDRGDTGPVDGPGCWYTLPEAVARVRELRERGITAQVL